MARINGRILGACEGKPLNKYIMENIKQATQAVTACRNRLTEEQSRACDIKRNRDRLIKMMVRHARNGAIYAVEADAKEIAKLEQEAQASRHAMRFCNRELDIAVYMLAGYSSDVAEMVAEWMPSDVVADAMVHHA